jgi:hypothetical protein
VPASTLNTTVNAHRDFSTAIWSSGETASPSPARPAADARPRNYATLRFLRRPPGGPAAPTRIDANSPLGRRNRHLMTIADDMMARLHRRGLTPSARVEGAIDI